MEVLYRNVVTGRLVVINLTFDGTASFLQSPGSLSIVLILRSSEIGFIDLGPFFRRNPRG